MRPGIVITQTDAETIFNTLLVAAGVVLVVIIFWLIHRRTTMSDGLTPLERKELLWQEREILAMLQSEIIDLLPGDLQDLTEVMKAVEDKGFDSSEMRRRQERYVVTAYG